MIKLNDTLSYDESKTFDQQKQEVKNFIQEKYYAVANLNPPQDLIDNLIAHGAPVDPYVATYESGETIFDPFGRPEKVAVKTDTYQIEGLRVYQDSTTAWRLHSEILTIKAL